MNAIENQENMPKTAQNADMTKDLNSVVSPEVSGAAVQSAAGEADHASPLAVVRTASEGEEAAGAEQNEKLPSPQPLKPEFTQNRELSWLKFNERVLNESMDNTVPLLERLKFISIFSSNLDEFFMVRVGSLYDLNLIDPSQIDKKSGMTPKEQIDAIYSAVKPLYLKKTEYYRHLMGALKKYGIENLRFDDLSPDHKKEVKQFFQNYIKPVLSPIVIDSHHPFPHLENKKIYVVATLKLKNKETPGIVPIPASVPPVLYLSGGGVRYIYAEDILAACVDQVFEDFEILEKSVLRVTRNADINLDDKDDMDDGSEGISDFRAKMRAALKKRKRLAPVRLELSNDVSEKLKAFLYEKLSLSKKSTYITEVPMDLSNVFGLPKKVAPAAGKILNYAPLSPKINGISMADSILAQIRSRDILLSYPYESMEPFLKFIKEASEDRSVVSIKITIYRLSSQSKLVEYLCRAAENGKDVTVLIELRARFDEQNNIDWSERLEEAGCNILYGEDDYKVHSKICLVCRKERNEIRYYTQIGTGNYNENTAKLYTDLSLMTYDQEIGRDANAFFQNMGIGNLNGKYTHLLVAPNALKKPILDMIEREIQNRADGSIFIKVNSLTDLDIINTLQRASGAGVKVTMMVRGICCLLPGIPGKTDNITIFSVVGRFLEHSRIYVFGTGHRQKVYISSADFMTRNTERRVEVACPIYAENVKKKIFNLIDACMADNAKARVITRNGDYALKDGDNHSVNYQELMIENTYEEEPPLPRESSRGQSLARFFDRLRELFGGRSDR